MRYENLLTINLTIATSQVIIFQNIPCLRIASPNDFGYDLII